MNEEKLNVSMCNVPVMVAYCLIYRVQEAVIRAEMIIAKLLKDFTTNRRSSD